MQKLANGLKSLVRWALPKRLQEQLRSHYLTRKVMAGQYVEPEMAMLNSLVNPGQVVLDIGANVGFYTAHLSGLVGPSGRVYSFEPITENFRILERVVKGKRLENVTTIWAAVGREPGEWNMVIPDKSDFTGFYEARLANEKDTGKKQPVRVFSLDQLLADGIFSSVDFIKCDAEGSELDILLGGIQLLTKNSPLLLIEVQRKTGDEVFKLLHSLGYRSFVLKNGLSETNQFDPAYWNYFFLPQKVATLLV